MIVYLQETRADDDGGSNAPPKRNFRHWWILVGVNPKQTLIPADCKQARCQLLVTGKCRFDLILYVQYVKDGEHSRLGSFLNKENKKPNRIRVKKTSRALPVSSHYIRIRRPLRVRTCQTLSSGLQRASPVFRTPQSGRQLHDPTRIRFCLWLATCCRDRSSTRQMVMENTWHEMNTYALGNFMTSLGKNDIPTGTVVVGKVIG